MEDARIVLDAGIQNDFKVPQKQWKKWGTGARRVFNSMMESMKEQEYFLHPKATVAPPSYWSTTQWNAAWTAADIAQDIWGK